MINNSIHDQKIDESINTLTFRDKMINNSIHDQKIDESINTLTFQDKIMGRKINESVHTSTFQDRINIISNTYTFDDEFIKLLTSLKSSKSSKSSKLHVSFNLRQIEKISINEIIDYKIDNNYDINDNDKKK